METVKSARILPINAKGVAQAEIPKDIVHSFLN